MKFQLPLSRMVAPENVSVEPLRTPAEEGRGSHQSAAAFNTATLTS